MFSFFKSQKKQSESDLLIKALTLEVNKLCDESDEDSSLHCQQLRS
jgi:hypothetical protein